MIRKEFWNMKIYVCVGSSCHLKGSYDIVSAFKKLISENNLGDKVELSASFCLGHCSKEGVSVKIEDKIYNVLPASVEEFFQKEVVSKLE